MSYKCEFKEQPAQPVLSVRTTTSVHELPLALGKAYGAIAQYLGELGEQPAGPPFAAYYSMDMQALDVEAGFPVARALPGNVEILAGEIPGGTLATVLHTGPYNQCRAAYEALAQYVKDNGREASGVAYEMYLNDPQQVLPQELQTLVVFPLK